MGDEDRDIERVFPFNPSEPGPVNDYAFLPPRFWNWLFRKLTFWRPRSSANASNKDQDT